DQGALSATASGDAARPGWHAPGVLRSLRRVHANADGSASAERLVHRGAGERSAYQHRSHAMTTMIEREPVGADNVADLILLNYKGADFVGHKYGPDSSELRVTLGEMDRHLTRILRALEAKVGNNYLLAVTADHGMPSEPSSPTADTLRSRS